MIERKKRLKRVLAIVLSAAMVFSANTAVFADEAMDAAVYEEEAAGRVRESTLVSGNVSISMNDDGIDDVWAVQDSADPKVRFVSEDQVKPLILERTEIRTGDRNYKMLDGGNGKILLEGDGSLQSISGNLSFRYYLAKKDGSEKDLTELEVKNGRIMGINGNQSLICQVTLKGSESANKVVGKLNKEAVATGMIFVHVPNAGKVITKRIDAGSTKGGQKAYLEVLYDAAVEYRGSKTTASNHRYGDDNFAAVDGTIDGAVGVAVRFVKVSANGTVTAISGNDYGRYFWQDDTGIIINKAVMKNNKSVASEYDEKAPYFTLKVSFKDSDLKDDDCLTKESKRLLRENLQKEDARFKFTIEPKKIASRYVTYKKKYVMSGAFDTLYAQKATVKGSSIKTKLTFMTWKVKNGTMNSRVVKALKAMKAAKKSKDGKSWKTSKGKIAGDFIWTENAKTVTIQGVNNYRGKAEIQKN